jgi:hypothetical protein
MAAICRRKATAAGIDASGGRKWTRARRKVDAVNRKSTPEPGYI